MFDPRVRTKKSKGGLLQRAYAELQASGKRSKNAWSEAGRKVDIKYRPPSRRYSAQQRPILGRGCEKYDVNEIRRTSVKDAKDLEFHAGESTSPGIRPSIYNCSNYPVLEPRRAGNPSIRGSVIRIPVYFTPSPHSVIRGEEVEGCEVGKWKSEYSLSRGLTRGRKDSAGATWDSPDRVGRFSGISQQTIKPKCTKASGKKDLKKRAIERRMPFRGVVQRIEILPRRCVRVDGDGREAAIDAREAVIREHRWCSSPCHRGIIKSLLKIRAFLNPAGKASDTQVETRREHTKSLSVDSTLVVIPDSLVRATARAS
ncbi:hypothetical protein FB451DRAFT_1178683 [Mycena latifolia]|nr:hypothetical protein FB451DRAFT_1178683 [Mycena latifolia]